MKVNWEHYPAEQDGCLVTFVVEETEETWDEMHACTCICCGQKGSLEMTQEEINIRRKDHEFKGH